MIRAIILFVALFAAALAAAWLADHPGNLSIDWQDWRIEAPVALVAVALALVFGMLALVYRFWLWMSRSPQAMAQRRERTRERQGYEALTKGLVAVAAGDAGQARTLAREAENLLASPSLTRLLSAQAAQLDGDDVAARHYFEEMLSSPETKFLALRGLLNTALRSGDRSAALEYASQAHRERPDANWATEALFDLQAQAGMWKEAQATLADAGRQKAMSPEKTQRRKAIALHAQALEAEGKGDRRKAIKLFNQAHEAAPGFVPVAVDGARLLLAANKIRRAAEIIERCWQENPHPALADLYLTLWSGEKANYVLQRLERLHNLKPGSREGRVALARRLIDSRDFDAARKHLAPLIAESSAVPPEQRLCQLMADLEEGQSGQAADARDWLMQLQTAPEDPVWACTDCGNTTTIWSPHCPACEAFDTLAWQSLPEPEMLATETGQAPGQQSADHIEDDPLPAPDNADIDERPASA
jgi:HemY protein